MCLFGIPYNEQLRYFCSHFVADILKKSGAADMKKSSSLYLPGDLRNIDNLKIAFEGNILTFAQYFGLLPCPV